MYHVSQFIETDINPQEMVLAAFCTSPSIIFFMFVYLKIFFLPEFEIFMCEYSKMKKWDLPG